MKYQISAVLTAFFLMASLEGKEDNREGAFTDWTAGILVFDTVSSMTVSDTGSPVDAETGRAVSVNTGRYLAFNQARETAKAHTAAAINGIRIDSEKDMAALLSISDTTKKRLSAIIENENRFTYTPAGFTGAVYRLELTISEIIPALPFTYPGDEFPLKNSYPVNTPYTSLIVDTRGQDIRPMIFPSIYNEQGLEIYGRSFIDITKINPAGSVLYVYSENEALNHKKAGKAPFFTVSLQSLNGCPVLNSPDIKKIFGNEQTRNNLKACRVIFIIGRN